MKTERNFMTLVRAKWAEDKFVCVGLDSEKKKVRTRLPKTCQKHVVATNIADFNCEIVADTHHIVAAYKPNIAFYHGFRSGIDNALRGTIGLIKEVDPSIPVILDCKVGDIGSTNEGYIDMVRYLGADALTINPYLGQEANQPFLDLPDLGIIPICRTSNRGSDEFQCRIQLTSRQELQELTGLNYYESNHLAQEMGWDRVPGISQGWFGIPAYQWVAMSVRYRWNTNGNCALVVGATYPTELRLVRKLTGDVPILVPGVGAQGGKIVDVLNNGLTEQLDGVLINDSRRTIFAAEPGEYIGVKARGRAQSLHNEITHIRTSLVN